ncbi:MAG: ABC transporter ATP-binding protein [Candidatus Heimdallarchaeota archaeon]|nr:ABC transporter ATP-binding protein [Candidatus Heimdallarchaeota archaeon]MBY8994643.1 ABC transporter ATP-binding protein [Candidatus Heimdallarchaeota archaeon]
MFKMKQKEQKKSDLTIWNAFYFYPTAMRETDQFKREVIRYLKKLKPISYEFEELTAFLILRSSYNTEESMEKIDIEKPETKEELASNFLAIVHEGLEKAYKKYLEVLTNRFLNEMKKNRELKEATNILTRRLALTSEQKEVFISDIYQLIETKAQYYYDVILNSKICISTIPEVKHSLIEIGEKKIGVYTEEPIINLLDEMILYNFAIKYTEKTNLILDQFVKFIKKVNTHLRKQKKKSNDIEELFNLLKGKSFEALDNIFDIRRQIARQNRADLEIQTEVKGMESKELSDLITKISPKKSISKIVKLTDEATKSLEKWFENIRKIELIKQVEPQVEISEEFNIDIRNLFIQMELLRIWSDFFYDISYYTVKEGRVFDAEKIEYQDSIETEAILLVNDVFKTYKLPKSRVYALRGVSFEINQGEFIAIMGPSGAGKTTMVNILTGLDTPDKGAVYLKGQNMALMDDTELTEFRRDQIGLIFQFYQLFAELTAIENVSMPAEMAGMNVKEAREKAQQILEIVDLGNFANQYPDKLSGGQQQRVAIARALVNDPSIVVADQLTGDLDSVTGMQIIGYLRKINAERGVTVLLVTHNKAVATQTDRILTIEDGELIEEIDMKALRSAD